MHSRRTCAASVTLGGLLDTRSGHLHPLKYTFGLARAAEREGVKIFENTEVLRYDAAGGGAAGGSITVHTANGTLHCAHLILCGNAYLGRVHRRWRGAFWAWARI
jgi:gamma-glutamylputrescine oxidase